VAGCWENGKDADRFTFCGLSALDYGTLDGGIAAGFADLQELRPEPTAPPALTNIAWEVPV
jgi:hypothetical protein